MQYSLTDDIIALEKKANSIRKHIIISLEKSGSGHSAGALGMADVFAALYNNVMRHDPKRPQWKDRDRLILSAGHICPVWYAALAEAGYFPKRELWSLRKLGSPLQGHPHLGSAPGVENTGGPLGQGVSLAMGIAYALKYFEKSDARVYCISSDGEHNEGQVWEAALFAAKYKLDNVVLVIDRNNIQIDGTSDTVMPLEPFAKKYQAFNWRVFGVNGNNMKSVVATFKKIRTVNGKPVCVIAQTIPGKGVSFMEGKYEWHGKPPHAEEAAMALSELSKKRTSKKTS